MASKDTQKRSTSTASVADDSLLCGLAASCGSDYDDPTMRQQQQQQHADAANGRAVTTPWTTRKQRLAAAAFACVAILSIIGATVGITLACVAGSGSGGIVVNGTDYDLKQATDRAALLDKIKVASGQAPPPETTQGDAEAKALVEQYKIDPKNRMRYASGQRRRPTDPATPEEVQAALNLLFGPTGKIASLEEADALAANPRGWQPINAKLAAPFKIWPEYIAQANRISIIDGDKDGSGNCSSSPLSSRGSWTPYVGGPGTTTGSGAERQPDCAAGKREQAGKRFHAEVVRRGGDVAAAHAWLRTQDDLRAQIKWHNLQSTTTWVDKEAALAVDPKTPKPRTLEY